MNSDQSAVISEESPQSSEPSPQEEKHQQEHPQASQKTQGVRPPRGTNAQVLQDLAKKAAHSNSRNDVHEYMRLRRNYV